MNEELDRVRALVGATDEPVVVLDGERRVVASNVGLPAGRRLGDVDDALVLFVGGLPALSAYEELRAGFTAAVSHELRTPLARLLVLLESTTLDGADVHELVEQARQEIQQARELIDDVLFLGELETGREVVSLGRTVALPILDEIARAYEDRAAHAGVHIVVTGGVAIELPLRQRMLRVVVENLVQNALRYSGPGSTCRVSVEQESETAILAVADDGAGVRESELPRLFERFYRADQARTSRGTGLGLAIVKHVVTAAGGTVDARSAPGKGLEIVCRFPAT
ncbi:MAG TPA: HAMP domain-containing sensor histidine kinase [Gaiellaceae bacterium]|nr:HAMP domain-containing sensor histidine kinase [Gaiellaceae bacterium]